MQYYHKFVLIIEIFTGIIRDSFEFVWYFLGSFGIINMMEIGGSQC